VTAKKLSEALSLTPLTGDTGTENEVTGCYIGDLLSHVMVRAPAGSAWITVMGNINAVAVACMADISCIILCENSPLDKNAKAQAIIEGIPVFTSQLPAYPLALRIAALLGDRQI